MATVPNNPQAKQQTALDLLHDASRELGGVHFSYGGHRSKAMKEIQRAIRELTPPSPPRPTPAPATTQYRPHPPVSNTPIPQQSQGQADAKMKAALKYLVRAQERIPTNSAPAEDVSAAIAEVNAALQHQN